MDQTIVLAGVDATPAAAAVVAAAKASAERAGASVLLAHSVTTAWGATIPAFQEHEDTPRVVEHGPPGARILAAARGHGAGLIVVGARGRGRLRPSVSRAVVAGAACPVIVVGPSADPEALRTGTHLEGEAATGLAERLGLAAEGDRPAAVVVRAYDAALIRRSRVPVVVLPAA
jgi:nucleotide-binding universal stress UspA family protein